MKGARHMKRNLSVLALLLILALLAACAGGSGGEPTAAPESDTAAVAAQTNESTGTPESGDSAPAAWTGGEFTETASAPSAFSAFSTAPAPLSNAPWTSAATSRAAQTTTQITTPSAKKNPVVYFTSAISPAGLMAVYKALGVTPAGNIAIKVSTGEPPNSNYLRGELIGDFTRALDGTIVECNTAYGGSRSSDAKHIQVAKDHGFYDMTPKGFDLLDAGKNSLALPVVGGEVLKENYVGAHFANYDYFVVLSHFKGHAMGGYGGAIKNISIGLGSKQGKCWIHTGGKSKLIMLGLNQNKFLMSMAEAGKSVVDSLNGNILFINVMNRLSVDCDCVGNPAEPDMHDIGILASFDPVAVDKACVDLVRADPDGAPLMQRIDSKNGTLTYIHGAKIGLGSMEYKLVDIDD